MEQEKIIRALRDLENWAVLNTPDFPVALVNAVRILNEIDKEGTPETFSEQAGGIGVQAMEFIKANLPAAGIIFVSEDDEDDTDVSEHPEFLDNDNLLCNAVSILPIEVCPGEFKVKGYTKEWSTESCVAVNDLAPMEACDLADFLTDHLNKIANEK